MQAVQRDTVLALIGQLEYGLLVGGGGTSSVSCFFKCRSSMVADPILQSSLAL